jgi:hypothetical protein
MPAVLLYYSLGIYAWQEGPRTPTAQRLGSFMSAAGAVAPCSTQLQVDPRAPTAHRLCSPVTEAALVALEASTWQAGPRAPAAQRFGSPMPAALLYCPLEAHAQ